MAKWAFDRYVGSHNPPSLVSNELYYDFSVGDVDFFVLDTRSFRDNNWEDDNIGNPSNERYLSEQIIIIIIIIEIS